MLGSGDALDGQLVILSSHDFDDTSLRVREVKDHPKFIEEKKGSDKHKRCGRAGHRNQHQLTETLS